MSSQELASVLRDFLRDFLREELGEGTARPHFVAVDGRSGSGKSTIAGVVASELREVSTGRALATVIDGDDFYAGGSAATWDSRSAEDKVAGVIDWRRQRLVLDELRQQGQSSWRAFDWEHPDWDAEPAPLASLVIRCRATPVVILEGAYSARPELADRFDLRVLVEAPERTRRERILRREGLAYRDDWFQRWSEAETLYFGQIATRTDFDLVLTQKP